MTDARRHRRVLPVLLACGWAVSGCSPVLFDLPDEPPPARYQLAAPEIPRECAASGPPPPVLVVERPVAHGLLAGPRIVVRSVSGEVRHLAGARWASPLPGLVDRLLVESLDSLCLRVTRERIPGALRLTTEVVRFQVVGGPQQLEAVQVEIRAQLLGSSPANVLATTRLAAERPLTEPGRDALIAAFEAALGQVLIDLRRWHAASVSRATDDGAAGGEPARRTAPGSPVGSGQGFQSDGQVLHADRP